LSVEVVWSSDFEDETKTPSVPTPWVGVGHIGGTIVRASDDLRVFEGSYACKITTPLGIRKAFGMLRRCPTLRADNRRFGLECWVSSPGTQAAFLDVKMGYYDPERTYYYEAVLRWDIQNKKWRYLTGLGYGNHRFEDVPDSTFMPHLAFGELFHHFKVVFDFGVGKYVRLLADYLDHDLTAYNLSTFKADNTDTRRLMDVSIHVTTLSDVISVYVDKVTLTCKEP